MCHWSIECLPGIGNSSVNDLPFSRIDMYVEGLRDLSDMIMFLPLSLPEEKEMNLEYILHRAKTRFFPVYEKVSNNLWLFYGLDQRRKKNHQMKLKAELLWWMKDCKLSVQT